MLVNGFIATMGYSYQTSIYSKSGANNYGICMNNIYKWNTYKNCGTDGREEKGKKEYYDKQGKHTELTFKGVQGGNLENLYVGVDQVTTLDETVPGTLPFKDKAFAPKDGTADHPGEDQLADNRKVIVYYPEYFQAKDNASSLGKVVVRADYSKTPAVYDWVVSPSGGTSKNENLAGVASIAKVGDKHVIVEGGKTE